MASIEAIDFDRIRRGDMHEAGNGIELVWEALNAEISARQKQLRLAINRSERAVFEYAPTGNVNDLDIGDTSIVLFTGASSVNLTGLLAPSAGAARSVVLAVLGAGTITVKHNATSENANRILTFSVGDVAIATNKFMRLLYLNSRWREEKLV